MAIIKSLADEKEGLDLGYGTSPKFGGYPSIFTQ